MTSRPVYQRMTMSVPKPSTVIIAAKSPRAVTSRVAVPTTPRRSSS